MPQAYASGVTGPSDSPNITAHSASVQGYSEAWHSAPDLMKALLDSVSGAYDVKADLDYVRGVPPTVNEKGSVEVFREAAALVLGENAAIIR